LPDCGVPRIGVTNVAEVIEGFVLNTFAPVPVMTGHSVWTSGTQSTATTAPYIILPTGTTSTATKTTLYYSYPMKIGGTQVWWE